MGTEAKARKYNLIIRTLSVIIPLAVAVLFGVKIPHVEPLSFLPPIYATLNGLTAVILVAAVVAIKKGNRTLHKTLTQWAMLCSVLFLLMYVAYHMTSDATPFGGEGVIRNLYYFVLITHIVLSVIIIPLVLFTYARARLGRFAAHKKLAKIAFPLWLYVAITGVLVYLMIAPYYNH